MDYKKLYLAFEKQYKTKYKGDKSLAEYIAEWLSKAIYEGASSIANDFYDSQELEEMRIEYEEEGREIKYIDGAEFVLGDILKPLIENSEIAPILSEEAESIIKNNA